MSLRFPAVVSTPELRASAEAPRRAEVDIAMERYAEGDDSSFAAVYDVLAPRLYGYLLRRSRDRSIAEDVLQQTLLHMHRARGRFVPGAAVTPWAFAIARRLLVDVVRRQKRERAEPDESLATACAEGPLADELVVARELEERIELALRGLPDSQRVAFELVKQADLTMAEAAEVLGTTVAAVKLRPHRACVALRVALGDTEGRLLADP